MAHESIVFRQRLAEALSRGGLNDRAVASEVLLLLPGEFVTWYEQLYLRVWQPPGVGGGWVGDESALSPEAVKWRTGSGQVETRGTASTKGRGSISKGLGVKDTRAEATKAWADRQLRKITREIKARLEDSDSPPARRCTGVRCRRIADATWNYCPACGAPTEEDDRQ